MSRLEKPIRRIEACPRIISREKFMEWVEENTSPEYTLSWIYFGTDKEYDDYQQMKYEDSWAFRCKKKKIEPIS